MFTYQAALYCDDCGEGIARTLFDRGEDDHGDSDTYPQSVLEGETDSPSHCNCGEECLNRIDLEDYGLEANAELYGAESRRIGALLAETLTEDGVRYAYDLVTTQDPTSYQRALHRLWRESFPAIGRRIEWSARLQGIADGKAAGSWVIDGNTTEEAARAILRGLEDCDPAVIDMLPCAPLSGEYADGILPRDVLGWYGLTEDDTEADDVLRTYEDGYSEGVSDEVERSARAILPTEPEPEQRGYNGWTNYPTWAVNLWLSNEEPLYREALEIASAPVDLLGSESHLVYVDEDRRQRIATADRLKDWVRDIIDLDEASMRADLVGYALDEVDWDEIAGAWLEQIEEIDA